MKEGMIQSEVTAVIQPRILFKPGSWLSKIDFINHLILFNNVLITVLAEKEGGKSSFNTLLQSNLDQQIKSVSITMKPSLKLEDILKDFAHQLNLDSDENPRLSSLVNQINERKAHVLLLIDDAQNLPESFIKEAMQEIKNQENFSFFHLCLLSDYSIVATLNNLVSSFFDNLVHTIELGSLNESETRTYVLQRAMSAHLIHKPLTDAQFKQFYQLTKGNVAKINSNLEPFIYNCTNSKKKEPSKWAKKAGIAASVTLIAGFIGFYFAQNYDLLALYRTKTTCPGPHEAPSPLTKLEPQPDILVSQIPSWEDSSTRQIVFNSLPKKQVLDDLEEELPNNTVAIIDKVVVIPKLELKNLAQQEPRIPDTEIKLQNPEADHKRESKAVEIPTPKQHKKTNSKSVIKSNRYTIQIAASHNKKYIERFRMSHQMLARNAKVRHFTNAKGIWYVLTLGEFDNRMEAQRNLSKLPLPLNKLNPWVRPVSNFG